MRDSSQSSSSAARPGGAPSSQAATTGIQGTPGSDAGQRADTSRDAPVSRGDAAQGTGSATSAPEVGTSLREDRIREAAYRRFEARGGTPGDELQDWLDAEAELDDSPDAR